MTAAPEIDLERGTPVPVDASGPSRRAVVWVVVAALVVLAGTAWFVRQETLLAQWRANHERLLLTAMQRVDDELNRQVYLPRSQRSGDALAAAANIDLSGGTLVDLGGGQVVWKSQLLGSSLDGSTVEAVYGISTDALPVNSVLGTTDQYDELVSIYTASGPQDAVNALEVRVCLLRHGTSADAPITTSTVQLSEHQNGGPCPAEIVAAWG